MTEKQSLSEEVLGFEKSCPPEWRRGQCLFNILVGLRPDIAKEIRATQFDPFHMDEKINSFLERINQLALIIK